MPPRIAIPLPTSTDLAYNRLNWPAYAQAVAHHGAEPVQVPLDLDERSLSHVAGACDGFLLPGSPADVDPSSYGQAQDPATAPADHKREEVDRFLLEHAYLLHKPLLGVCFGAQMLNVHRGGTLVQDLTVLPVNHACSRAVFTAHSVTIPSAARLAECVDPAEATERSGYLRLLVNSSHHQAIGIAGERLRIAARCPEDAVIEAVEGTEEEHFVLGVQWHPERTVDSSATSTAIFRGLAFAAEKWLRANGSGH